MKSKIVIKKHGFGYRFEVYVPGPKIVPEHLRHLYKGTQILVASGERSTKVLAETAAAREAAVYVKIHEKKGDKR